VATDLQDLGDMSLGLLPGDHVYAFHFGPSERQVLLRHCLEAGVTVADSCRGADPREAVLCLWDLDDGDPATISDLLVSHPKLLVGRQLTTSPWYVPGQTARPVAPATVTSGPCWRSAG
jgi:hypothetical protein